MICFPGRSWQSFAIVVISPKLCCLQPGLLAPDNHQLASECLQSSVPSPAHLPPREEGWSWSCCRSISLVSAFPEPRFGFTAVPNVFEDLLMLVVSWMMTSNKLPNPNLWMEQPEREMGSSVAILDIRFCCCGFKANKSQSCITISNWSFKASSLRFLRDRWKGYYPLQISFPSISWDSY